MSKRRALNGRVATQAEQDAEEVIFCVSDGRSVPYRFERDLPPRARHLSLTRMIYAFCGAITLYWILNYASEILVAFYRDRVPWGLYRWYYVTNAWFVVAMLLVAAAYRFDAKVLGWRKDSTHEVTGWVQSISLGILGGTVALLLGGLTVWFGWGADRLRSIEWLIADALSPGPIFVLLVVIFALAFTSEVVFRGIVFKTLAQYTTIPAAVLASCLLFACFFPVLGFMAAIILGVMSSTLYYRTKNLIAPVTANALFTAGCSGIALYH